VQPVYEAVKLAGAAYLAYLAFHLLRSARRREEGVEAAEAAAAAEAAGAAAGADAHGLRLPVRPARTAFRAGFLTNIGNPKAAVFFSSIFAALLPAHVTWSGRMLAGGAMLAMAAAWFTIVACLFSAKRIAAGYARARRVVDGLTGALFAALAVEIAAD
jgi:threonine/homoserine/homoserine lactone efflux protein